MNCEICHKAPDKDPDVKLFRANPKGVPGIWWCGDCIKRNGLTIEIDPEVLRIVDDITGDNNHREVSGPSAASVKAQLAIADEALREICHTSPLVDSGLSFREWAKSTARAALERIHDPEPDSLLLENATLMALTENERDAWKNAVKQRIEGLCHAIANQPQKDAGLSGALKALVSLQAECDPHATPPVDNAFVAEGCEQFPPPVDVPTEAQINAMPIVAQRGPA